MNKLKGKTALVTGASSGIGYETVLSLLSEGAVVYAAARRVDRMAGLEGKGARTLALDVTDENSLKPAVERILQEAGAIDILVNNAGYGSYGALEDVPLDEARRQFDVNVFGLARLTQMALPGMREKGWGRIVNISSMGGRMYTPFGAWYHATKYAVEALTDCLRLETKPFGIDAVLVEPGGIKTDWGAIAAENLRKTSAGGPYAESASRTAEGISRMYGGKGLTHPRAIANTVLRAVTAKRPRTRYLTGFMAKPAVFLRGILPDRAFDRIIGFMS